MTVKQIVIDRNKEGKVTDITLHHHEQGQGPVMLFYNPPVKWDLKVPVPEEKYDMSRTKKPIKKKHKTRR